MSENSTSHSITSNSLLINQAIHGETTTLTNRDFGDLDIQKLLKVIHQLCYQPSGLPTEEVQALVKAYPNFKIPPKSYGSLKWEKATVHQGQTFLKVFQSLPEPWTQKVSTLVQNAVNPVGRSDTVTKNDLCRLLHLRMHSNAIQAWTKALCPMERSELDAACSDSGIADAFTKEEPFNKLAEMFNNRESLESNDFQPENLACLYQEGKKNPRS